MKKLSLVDKDLVDKLGVTFRLAEDMEQLGLSLGQCSEEKPPIGFQDHGFLIYQGVAYYASTYDPPAVKEDKND